MGRMESRVKLPARAHRLSDYARYYTFDGSGQVVAIYTTFVDDRNRHYDLAIGQRRWVESERSLPGIEDGGCDVVTVTFDPAKNTVTNVSCNGEA